MASKKIVVVEGMGELEKLEASGQPDGCKFVIEKGICRLGRRPMVMRLEDKEARPMVVSSSPQMVTVCLLNYGEEAPSSLPRVKLAYL